MIMRTIASLLILALTARPAVAQDSAKAPASDRAVHRALDYLKASQKPDGAWESGGFGQATSVTSLSVMAFLAAGHVPGEPGPYRETIERGIRYVLAHQQAERPDRLEHEPRADVLPRDQHADARRGRRHDGRPRAGRASARRPWRRAVELILMAQNLPKNPEPRRRLALPADQPRQRPERHRLAGHGAPRREGGRVRGAVREHRPGRRLPEALRRRRTAAGSATSRAAGRTTRGPAPASSPWRSAASTSRPRPSPAPSTCSSTRRSWSSQYFFYEVYYCLAGHVPGGRQVLPRLLPQARRDPARPPGARTGAGSPATATTAPAAGNYCTAMAVLALAVEYRYLPIYQR